MLNSAVTSVYGTVEIPETDPGLPLPGKVDSCIARETLVEGSVNAEVT